MGSDFQDTGAEVLVISTLREGQRAIVALEGELDLHGSDRLTEAIHAALDDRTEIVELDAARLTFADSAGLRAVLLARSATEQTGALFRLTNVTDPVGRVIDIAGLTELLLPADG